MIEWFNSLEFSPEFIASIILLVAGWFVRFLATIQIRRSNFSVHVKRKWIVHVRNAVTLFFVLGLVIVWSDQLHTFALSITAVAVALVISTKELILCALGGILKASSNSFQVGDRIEVGEIRGDVVDHDIMTTKVLEIGPHRKIHQKTGRAISIPNSLFLSHPIINESSMHKYVLHTFSVPFHLADDWKRAKEELLAAAQEVSGPIVKEVQNFVDMIGKKEGVASPDASPRIAVHFPDAGVVTFIVRFPAPATSKGDWEQKILKTFMEKFYGTK